MPEVQRRAQERCIEPRYTLKKGLAPWKHFIGTKYCSPSYYRDPNRSGFQEVPATAQVAQSEAQPKMWDEIGLELTTFLDIWRRAETFFAANMDSVRMWLLKKVDFLKHMILGSPDVEPAPLPPWSLESPFQTWNIYSKASLAASMLCFIGFLVLFSRKKPIGHSKSLVKRKTALRLNVRTVHNRPTLDTWLEAFALLMVLCLFVTIPWEWVRLYQIEVAKKTTVLSEGYSNSCYREDHSFWEAVKVWLSWNFSWDKDSCEKYYKALIVDPVWEVTPLMGYSNSCYREDHSFWEAVKVWLSWNFSWDKDSCEKYYKALIVDPVWEVTPLM
ncbi:uncharacterized protein LOC142486774, partial [Ascaphus truei]|uniref:uncharacterized protein LOC142486774 n=1 Tax=Ascaphus truei TaxID=8439 RepID=UPI003F5AC73B